MNAITTKPEVGQILYSSWGYDQTNIDFYQIVRATDKGTVWLLPMSRVIVEETGFMSYQVAPGEVMTEREVYDWDDEVGRVARKVKIEPARHRWSKWGSVNLSSYASAFPWDREAITMTQYA
jgi:hypothetical protein